MTATVTRPAIAVTELRRSFGAKTVLDGIDLDVAEGTVAALLGPRGAGKTIMVHILSTRSGPTRGQVRVGGQRPQQSTPPGSQTTALAAVRRLLSVDRIAVAWRRDG